MPLAYKRESAPHAINNPFPHPSKKELKVFYMITGSFPIKSLAPGSKSHVVEEYVWGVRIKRSEEELRLRECQLIAQEHEIPINLGEARTFTLLSEEYLQQLEESYAQAKPKITHNEKEELERFVAYGVEIKYLPLYKYLQVSNKYVGTTEWRIARHEYLLGKAFSRYKEACEVQMELHSGTLESDDGQGKKRVWWDGVLEDCKWMAIDFREEREWKRQVAKTIAEEAAYYSKCKQKRQVPEEKYFYEPEMLPELTQKLSLNESNEKIEAQNVVEPQSNMGGPFVMGKGWREGEDEKLKSISALYRGNWDLVAEELNYYFHPQGHHRRTPAMCQERLRYLGSNASASSNGVVEMLREGERHLTRLSLIQSSRGKLVPLTRSTPLATLIKAAGSVSAGVKRNNTGVHPSHEAAVKRATQNITRMLTPGELALRRMQRMRQLMEGMRTGPAGASASSVASNVNSPIKQQLPQQSQQSQQSQQLQQKESSSGRNSPVRSKPPSRPTTPTPRNK